MLAVAVAASFWRFLTPGLFHLQSAGGVLSLAVLAAVALLFGALGRRLVGSVAAALYLGLLVMTPFAALNSGRALYQAVRAAFTAGEFAEPSRVRLAEPAPVGRRLLILLFDELDYEFLFVRRPPGLRLPEVDALHRQSWSAERAFPTLNATAGSVPALLSGVRVSAYRTRGPAGLTLTTVSGEAEWRDLPSIFSDARQRGIAAGVAGWYPAHLAAWRSVLEETERLALRADLGLVYAHFPIPHPPPIGRLVSETAPDGYAGNVRLVDESLGRIRRALRDAGRLDETAILLLSDHHHLGRQRGGRLGDPADPTHRVPVILHLPWEQAATRFREPVSLAAVRGLVMAFLDGRVERQADVPAALGRSGPVDPP